MRSSCPIAGALDLFGDKWTLLVLRDLMFRQKTTYGDLLQSPEGVATNILADRLDRLCQAGFIEKRGRAYGVTSKGWTLEPVMRGILRWGLRELPGTERPNTNLHND
ncbi:helix-turn-helix domain-containing protein [Magnetospira sp. QH-2]|uniref:winged helix-turn-helix transcriptional regulator n=1 Tax=Magnetospira sp. (strain QH-2) TaxID=1288970 RepID=UPI0009E506C4|nr:helix-turn-helix domain-containing protein [Magnetospira sp. QH-2]